MTGDSHGPTRTGPNGILPEMVPKQTEPLNLAMWRARNLEVLLLLGQNCELGVCQLRPHFSS